MPRSRSARSLTREKASFYSVSAKRAPEQATAARMHPCCISAFRDVALVDVIVTFKEAASVTRAGVSPAQTLSIDAPRTLNPGVKTAPVALVYAW